MEICLKRKRAQNAELSATLSVQQTIRSTYKRIKLPVNGREIPHVLNRSEDIAKWTRVWKREKDRWRQKESGKIAAFQQWKNSWKIQNREQHIDRPASADPEDWKAANIFIDTQTGSRKMTFKDTSLNIHRYLTSAKSSIVVQLRSKHIGLISYLYRRKVSGVENPGCQCGYPSQNFKHIVLAFHG